MKQLILLSVSLFSFSYAALSQADSAKASGNTEVKNWKMQSIFGANGTQASFVNWNAGGRNNISVLGFINAQANWAKGKSTWDNSLNFALGGLQYIGKDAGNASLQKTDDKIEISSVYGRKLSEHFFNSFFVSAKTQSLDGFSFPNDSVRVSAFLAPGYLNFGWGIDYKPSKHLSVFFSPLSAKMTFVKDQTLANAGSFGVDPAVYDTSGAITQLGKRFRGEFGAYLKIIYDKEIAKNINMRGTLDLFSNYLDRPQNIDVNADVLFTFKVNSWFSASVNWTLKYDNDINIRDAKGGYGPRTQFKSVLGLGISYTMKNSTGK
jgi:hypothetical protein